jgi:hypothetical protein
MPRYIGDPRGIYKVKRPEVGSLVRHFTLQNSYYMIRPLETRSHNLPIHAIPNPVNIFFIVFRAQALVCLVPKVRGFFSKNKAKRLLATKHSNTFFWEFASNLWVMISLV